MLPEKLYWPPTRGEKLSQQLAQEIMGQEKNLLVHPIGKDEDIDLDEQLAVAFAWPENKYDAGSAIDHAVASLGTGIVNHVRLVGKANIVRVALGDVRAYSI